MALLTIGVLVCGLGLFSWWTLGGEFGANDIVAGRVASIGVDPGSRTGNRVAMIVNAEDGTQIGLVDGYSGFSDCKVGAKIEVRRAKTSTGFVSYKFIPGSCSS